MLIKNFFRKKGPGNRQDSGNKGRAGTCLPWLQLCKAACAWGPTTRTEWCGNELGFPHPYPTGDPLLESSTVGWEGRLRAEQQWGEFQGFPQGAGALGAHGDAWHLSLYSWGCACLDTGGLQPGKDMLGYAETGPQHWCRAKPGEHRQRYHVAPEASGAPSPSGNR